MLNRVLRVMLPVFDCVSIMNLERMSWWLRIQYLLRRQNCANGKEQSAKRIAPYGFGTTDYRLLTSDPDPGIDDRESVVRCLLSLCASRSVLSPRYSSLNKRFALCA